MAVPTLTIVDTSAVIPNQGATNVDITIQRDGAAVDLSSKTETATVRLESAPDTVIDASLEDVALSHQDAVNGVTRLAISSAMKALLAAGPAVDDVVTYVGQVYVVEDEYPPQLFRLFVSKSF